jgi:predicted RND superfamily exporter protein
MKDYQVTVIIAFAVAAAAAFMASLGYYATTYSMAATALLCVIGFSFVAVWLFAEAIMDYRNARSAARWSAK